MTPSTRPHFFSLAFKVSFSPVMSLLSFSFVFLHSSASLRAIASSSSARLLACHGIRHGNAPPALSDLDLCSTKESSLLLNPLEIILKLLSQGGQRLAVGGSLVGRGVRPCPRVGAVDVCCNKRQFTILNAGDKHTIHASAIPRNCSNRS
eukprot:753561-Hanusia_phi.AAC.5